LKNYTTLHYTSGLSITFRGPQKKKKENTNSNPTFPLGTITTKNK